MHPIDEVLVALRNDRFFGYEQGIGMFPKREIDVGKQTRTERAADVRNPRAHTNRTAWRIHPWIEHIDISAEWMRRIGIADDLDPLSDRQPG